MHHHNSSAVRSRRHCSVYSFVYMVVDVPDVLFLSASVLGGDFWCEGLLGAMETAHRHKRCLFACLCMRTYTGCVFICLCSCSCSCVCFLVSFFSFFFFFLVLCRLVRLLLFCLMSANSLPRPCVTHLPIFLCWFSCFLCFVLGLLYLFLPAPRQGA